MRIRAGWKLEATEVAGRICVPEASAGASRVAIPRNIMYPRVITNCGCARLRASSQFSGRLVENRVAITDSASRTIEVNEWTRRYRCFDHGKLNLKCSSSIRISQSLISVMNFLIFFVILFQLNHLFRYYETSIVIISIKLKRIKKLEVERLEEAAFYGEGGLCTYRLFKSANIYKVLVILKNVFDIQSKVCVIMFNT